MALAETEMLCYVEVLLTNLEWKLDQKEAMHSLHNVPDVQILGTPHAQL